MAGNTININLAVTDNAGTMKQRNDDAKELNKNLSKAAQLSEKVMSAPARRKRDAAEGIEYGRGRGTMGATGAGARDFANEAQGLGGLVRVYATFAANIYAVSAAFNALREAANTTIMVRSLDELGSVSGVALGGLAKDFAAASGGAISFREAIEATAKATTSGLNSQQLMQLGTVAKGASQALGVNMSDAVSRLTRGITKLEPELLDELGLFTKVGKATEDYAFRVGKTVTSLTDFERRQAFANAVLTEGVDKYGALSKVDNPYDQLAASLKNVAQQGLEVVNVVLTPILKLLSSSPTALVGVLSLIGVTLLKQAIPALNQYRQELKSAAQDASDIASRRAEAAAAAVRSERETRAANLRKEADAAAQAKVDQIDEIEQRLKSTAKGGLSKSVQKILAKEAVLDITEADLKILDKLGEKNTKVSIIYKELADSIRAAKRANDEFIAGEQRRQKIIDARIGAYTRPGILQERAEQARQSAATKTILSGLSETTEIDGVKTAFSDLFKQVSEQKLGKIRTGFTLLAGTMNILGTAVNLVATAVQRFLGPIAIIIGAYTTLKSLLSSNAKEQDLFTDSVSRSEDLVKTSVDTLNRYKNTLDIQGVLANSTAAINTFQNSLDQLNTFSEAYKKASLFDLIEDELLDFIGKGNKDKLATSFSASIIAGINNIKDEDLRKVAVEKYKKALGIENLTEKEIKKAIAGKSSKEISSSLRVVIQDVTKSTQDAITETTVTPLENFKERFRAVETSYTALKNTLLNKDELTKFSLDGIAAINSLKEAFSNTTTSAAIFNDLLKDTSKIKFFTAEQQESILTAAKSLESLERARGQEQTKLVSQQSRGVNENTVNQTRQVLALYDEKISKIRGTLESALEEGLTNFSNNIRAPLTRALAESAIAAQKAVVSGLPKTAKTIEFQTKLELESISIRKQEITQIKLLTDAIERDRESRTLGEKIAEKQKIIESKDTSIEQKSVAIMEKRDLESRRAALGTKLDLSKPAPSGREQEYATEVAFQAKLAQLTGEANAIIIRSKGEIAKQQVLDQEGLKKLPTKEETTEKFKTKILQAPDKGAAEELARERDKEIASNEFISRQMQTQSEIEGYLAQAAQARSLKLYEAAKLAEDAANSKREELVRSAELYQATAANADVEGSRAVNLARTEELLANQKVIRDREYNQSVLQNEEDQRNLELQGQIVEQRASSQLISSDELVLAQSKIEISKAQLTYERAILDVNRDYAEALDKINKLKQASGGIITQEILRETQQAEDARINATTAAQNALNFAKDSSKLRKDMALSNNKVIEDMANVFRGATDSMADAMVEFVRTGKLNFKDLANSIIADIARIIIKQQLLNMFGTGWQGNLAKWTGSLLGISTPGTGGNYTGAELANLAGMAKGGAFEGGVEKFAKGGTFTNSIVSQPTLFKFAKGTGLMGEAGPEAIMPLKRDEDGNLGVRATSSDTKVEVVVNNYGKETATTQETVDSRGNRRIEVVIGDMQASEITRGGSASQRAIRGTFGLQPQLIRR